MSGQGNDKPGKTNSWRRSELLMEARFNNGTAVRGLVVIRPQWSADYQAMVESYLRSNNLEPYNPEATGVVMLGRYGDIINALPIVKRLHDDGLDPHVIMASEFAGILDGISYAKPVPLNVQFDQLEHAMKFARERFKNVVRCQIYGRGHNQERQTESFNMESWREAGMLNDFHNPNMPPVFDRRDLAREALLLKKLFRTDKPKIVTNLTGAKTAPFARGPSVRAAIATAYKQTHEVIEIGQLRLHRVYDLLAFIEKAAVFISIDTATLHLAAATKTPVIALVSDQPWGASIVRYNDLATIRYADATPKHVLNILAATLSGGVRRRFKRIGGKDVVVVRRTNSLGDALAATAVADALIASGRAVEFQAHTNVHPILRRHPRIKHVSEPVSAPDVDLDGAYENHAGRSKLHINEIYHERAKRDLEKCGVSMPALCNWAPELNPAVSSASLGWIKQFPKPWVIISPRSNCWANRTVPDAVWCEAAKRISGTCFWLGNHRSSPEGIQDLKCKTVEQLILWLSLADFVVTVDTGPMHIAAALKKPLLVIEQAVDPLLRLAAQRDFAVYSPPLDCLNCNCGTCPLPNRAESPPCQNIDPGALAAAVNLRLLSLAGSERTSAVIAVYKPNLDKLNRCLTHVLPQVDEVVVCGDLDTPWPLVGLTQNEKIRCVRRPQSATGYGKKATFGARHASGALLHLLNDDVYLNQGVIDILKSEMKPGVAIVTHTLRYMDGTIQYAGSYRPRGAHGFGHIDLKATKSRYSKPVEQETACGASMMIRREALFQAGAFDERYHLYSEDADLAMTVRKNGWKVMFTPHAEGLHEEHQSMNITPKWRDILHESNRKFSEKWRTYFQHNPNPNTIGTFP